MFLKACLNGSRTPAQHPALPVTPAALTAIRAACPGVEVGISTAAYIEPDVSRRVTLIETWTVLPDFVSVNLSEPGLEALVRAARTREAQPGR